MPEDKIPQYHESYTEEENRTLHQRLQNADDAELVELIYTLCNLYPESEQQNIKKALDNFSKEIYYRDVMEQKYKALLACENEWGKYLDSLYTYKDVLLIRQIYSEYKKTCKENDFLCFLDSKYHLRYPYEFIRRSTFKEESSHGIKKPVEPECIYFSLDSVPVTPLSFRQCLEKLGTANLKELFCIILHYIDFESDNAAPVIIGFLTRKYSYESHKKNPPLFASNTPSYLDLKAKSEDLIERIKKYRQEIKDLKEEMHL